MKARQICYVSGTRADYGLMRNTLAAIAKEPALSLSLAVTGMHLDPSFGNTISEIEADGHSIIARIPVPLGGDEGAQMARNIGMMIRGLTDALTSLQPDIVLLLGDRGEMLAGAIASIHLGIPVAHVHGGERSGTVDESVRHAITKLAHIHLAATTASAARIERMGEDPDHIHVVGAPGLDGLDNRPIPPREQIAARHGFDPQRPMALLLHHPEAHDTDRTEADTATILSALAAISIQTIALMPNSDAGAAGIRRALAANGGSADFSLHTHLPRDQFIDAMARVDVMVGNSSSGIIEAATFGTPVINLGSRQNLRERSANVRDVPIEFGAMSNAIAEMIGADRPDPCNVYGDGATGFRIAKLLRTYKLDSKLMNKVNSY